MNKRQKTPYAVSRRKFLRNSLMAGASAATFSSPVFAAIDEAPETPPQKDGYQLTQHILDYYKSAEV